MRYILLMTLSGNMLFMGFLFWQKVFGRLIAQSMRYRALIVTLLTYAVPWVWLKGVYRQILGHIWRDVAVMDRKGLFVMADIRADGILYRTEEYRVLMLMIGIWFVVAVSLVVFKTARHIQRCNALRRLAVPCPDGRLGGVIERLRKEFRYRRGLTVVWTRADNETITLGIWKPVIYLQKEYTENELYLILKHEMIHIVRKDLLIKLLQEFVGCVHWFNPLVHLLVREMQFVCEASCDERAAEGGGEGEGVEAYAALLDKNKKEKKLKTAVGGGGEDINRDMEKRVKLIREARKVGHWERIVSAGAFLVLVFVSSLTALAYPKARHIENAVAETVEDAMDGDKFLLYRYMEDEYGVLLGELLYDEQFIDQTGEIHSIDSGNPDVICTVHDLVQGYYKKHIKANGGNCVIETYKGARCRKCGMMEIGDLYLTTEQPSCVYDR